MKVVFCGTPEFAVPTLAALLAAGHQVDLVLTQPDRPAGRKQDVQMPAVKAFALEHGLRVEQPEKIRTNEALQSDLHRIAPEVIVVVAYGRILPPWMLASPRWGCLNLHGSLLPKYRGAAPIQWALANGEAETGVTVMRLDQGLDTGDVCLQRAVPVPEHSTSPQIYPLLAQLGAGMMVETLASIAAGNVVWQKQDHEHATLAPILTREDGRLDLTRTAAQTYNRWRGFMPWPGCWGEFRERRFLLWKLRVSEADFLEPGQPGDLTMHEGRLLLWAAQETLLELEEVQLEGKPRMHGTVFWKDFQGKQGERVA